MRSALFGVPLAFAGGALSARLLLQAAPPRWHADLAQPLVVVTAWGGFGLAFFAIFALTIAGAAAALAVALFSGRTRGAGPSLPATLVLAALALGAACAWPAVLSSDVYAYAAYGDAAFHGHSPYFPVVSTQHDAFVDAARWQWGGVSFPPCVYGPLFVAAAAAGVALAGDRLGPSLWAMRIIAALAFLASVALLDAALRGKRSRRFAVAAYALNPVALWCAAEGHNDTLLLAVVLGAFAWLRRGSGGLSGAWLGIAPLVKLAGIVAGPLTLVWLWARRDERARTFAPALAIACICAAAALLPLQLPALRAIAGAGRYAPQFSFQGLVGVLPALLVAIAAGVTGARALLRGDARAALWFAVAGWLAIPNPYPWYALWILPVAVALPPSRATIALWVATIFAALRYLPETFGNVPHLPAAVLTLVMLAPLAFALPARVKATEALKATATSCS